MIASLAGLVLVALATALGAPRMSRRMAPAAAAVLLTVLTLTVSLAIGAVLCLAGVIGVTEVLAGVRPADWSVPVMRETIPLPPAVGVAAGVIAAALVTLAAVQVVRLAVSLRRTSAAARDLACVGGLSIVEDDRIHAYAVPGRARRIVVSTGLLRSLSAPQRRAVLEHERAHLRHRHHRYAQLTRLAATANPLMRGVVRPVDVALERWADDDAARVTGDPATVARALAAAALPAPAALPAAALPARALGAAHDAVVERVRYLLEPPPRRGVHSAVLVLGTVLCWAFAAAVFLYVHGAIEFAEGVRR